MQKAEVSRHVLGFECRGFVILCFIKLKVLMCSVVSLECCLHCSTQKWSDYLLSSLQKDKWRLFQLTCLQEVACKKSSKISHRVLIDLDLREEHPGDRFYENLSGLLQCSDQSKKLFKDNKLSVQTFSHQILNDIDPRLDPLFPGCHQILTGFNPRCSWFTGLISHPRLTSNEILQSSRERFRELEMISFVFVQTPRIRSEKFHQATY